MLAWIGIDQSMKMRATSRGMDKKPYVNNESKTESCKQLAKTIYGSEERIIKIDCSELQHDTDVTKLIGSAAGYIGYENGGRLVNEVREKPYSIVLFDEIEKAHPAIFDLLLQILDEGTLKDSRGRVANFKNAIIIMTSNQGTRDIKKQSKVGFGLVNNTNVESEYESMKEQVMNSLKKKFRPEFLNRIDDIIVFNKLNVENINKITELEVEKVLNRLESIGMNIGLAEDVIPFISSKNTDLENGARPIKRIITKELENRIANAILNGDIDKDERVIISVENDELIIENVNTEELHLEK